VDGSSEWRVGMEAPEAVGAGETGRCVRFGAEDKKLDSKKLLPNFCWRREVGSGRF
jgi:hypothetical protein